MNKVTCSNCDSRIPDGKAQCPKCKKWTGNEKALVVDGSVMLSKVTSSDVDRISTGPWDIAYGTDYKSGKMGIARCSSNLLAGSPGAGKSTLALQILNASIPVTGEEGLYVAAEEPLEQIKARADRLSLENQDRIRMVQVMSGEGNIEEIIAMYRPGLLVLDSVNGIAGGDSALAVKVCAAVKVFSMKYRVPAIILSHINKGGEIAGLEALQHEVDSTMTFFPEGEETENGESQRILHVEKNRNGRAFISLAFLMTERGLVLCEEEEEEDDEE